MNFYEVGGIRMDPDDPDEFNVYGDPSWRRLLALAHARTDIIRFVNPVRSRSHQVNRESWPPNQSGKKPGFREKPGFKTAQFTARGSQPLP